MWHNTALGHGSQSCNLRRLMLRIAVCSGLLSDAEMLPVLQPAGNQGTRGTNRSKCMQVSASELSNTGKLGCRLVCSPSARSTERLQKGPNPVGASSGLRFSSHISLSSQNCFYRQSNLYNDQPLPGLQAKLSKLSSCGCSSFGTTKPSSCASSSHSSISPTLYSIFAPAGTSTAWVHTWPSLQCRSGAAATSQPPNTGQLPTTLSFSPH